MKMSLIVLFPLLSIVCGNTFAKEDITVAVIADCQYADKAPAGARIYRSCVSKLEDAMEEIDKSEAVAAFHLGDFIDEGYRHFEPLKNITNQYSLPFYHILGNHDFSVADEHKNKVAQTLGLPSRYYTFAMGQWRFVVIDGNDISHYGWPKGTEQYALSQELIANKYSELPRWNGGVGERQLEWLSGVLAKAQRDDEKVIILSHFPLYPFDRHVLWNHEQVMTLITQFSNVRAWFNGHNHEGDYAYKAGIHFITFNAMLDTEQTAYSIVKFTDSYIEIMGVGKQRSMKLAIP